MLKLVLSIMLFCVCPARAVCRLDGASIKFDGTAFAEQPFKLTATHIEFFQNTKRAFAVNYDPPHDRWCYQSSYRTKLRGARGCLKQVGKDQTLDGHKLKIFTLRDLGDRQVASLTVTGNHLELKFLLASGQPNGKRLRVTAPLNESQSLEVNSWNCPNENYLSCAGAHLSLKWEEGAKAEGAKPIEVADLANRLEYEANCSGLSELHPKEKGPVTEAFSNF